jgi:hypothetical protein
MNKKTPLTSFTTPEGRTYWVADDLLNSPGGVQLVAAVVNADREGVDTDVFVAEIDNDDEPQEWADHEDVP